MVMDLLTFTTCKIWSYGDGTGAAIHRLTQCIEVETDRRTAERHSAAGAESGFTGRACQLHRAKPVGEVAAHVLLPAAFAIRKLMTLLLKVTHTVRRCAMAVFCASRR